MSDVDVRSEQSRAEYLQEFLSEALTNNSFDYVPMHSALRKIYDNAYITTKRFQKSIQGYKEYQFFSNDDTHYNDDPESETWKRDLIRPGNLYVDEHFNACIDLEYSIISHANREEYRKSRFYHTWIDFDDLIENRDLFTKMPVIIIDNQVLLDYKIYIDRSYVKIRLPYKSDFVYYHERNMEKDRIKYIDHQVTIQMIDNVYWGRNINPITLNERKNYVGNLNRVKKTLILPYDYFTRTIDYAKLYEHFPHSVKGRVGLYFAVIHFQYTDYKDETQQEKLGSFLYDVDFNDETKTFTLHLDDQIINKINGPFYVTLIWYNELRKHTFFNGKDYTIAGDCNGNECIMPVIEKSELEPYPMPISVENMFVMRTSHGINVPDGVYGRDPNGHHVVEKKDLQNIKDPKEFEVFYAEYEKIYYMWKDEKWEPITKFFVEGGRSLSSGPMTLQSYYPNIYRIVDRPRRAGEKYEVYYFYHEDTVFRYKYTPLTLFWHYVLKYRCSKDKKNLISTEEAINAVYYSIPMDGSSIKSILSENYSDYNMPANADEFKALFDRYLTYNPYEYIYGDVDFYHKYVDVPHSVDFEDNTYPIEYKIAKMHEWIRQDQDYLRDYVVNQKRLGTQFHLFVKDLWDEENPDDPLEAYIRQDTSLEVNGNGDGVYTFKDDMYVFSLQNDDPSQDLPCVVFVDGLMCMEMHQINVKDITYIYLPTRMVSPESYIEVEIRPSYEFKQQITFNSLGDEKEITLIEPEQGIFPTVADLYFEDVVIPTRNVDLSTCSRFCIESDIITDSFDITNIVDSDLSTSGIIPKGKGLVIDLGVRRDIQSIAVTTDKSIGYNYSVVKVSNDDPKSLVVGDKHKMTMKGLGQLGSTSLLGDSTILSNSISSSTGTGSIVYGRLGRTYRYVIIEAVNADLRLSNIEVVRKARPDEAVVHRYSNNNFEITAHYRDMRNEAYNIECDVPLDPETNGKIRFTRLQVFTVRPKNPEVVGIPLNLRFSKCADLLRVTMSHDGFPYLSLVDRKFKYNGEYLRIFKDGQLLDRKTYGFPEFKEGRLMPKEKYSFISTYDHPRLIIYEFMNKGEQIMIDISPFRYKQVFYMEELPAGETVIDLSGYITKPFDTRYYDVYLNGRRLSLPNIVSIDAWSITLVNLFTTKHLQIFEKERDWEYFGLKYKDDDSHPIFYFAKEDILNLENEIITEDERNTFIKKIIDDRAKEKGFEIFNNIDAEKELDFTDYSKSYMMLLFYLHELIPKTYLNPDSFQTEIELMEDEYPNVLQNYKVEGAPVNTLLLDPDIITNKDDKFSTGKKDTSTDQVVCTVGHNDDVPEDVLDQEISIQNKKPIIGGE